MGNVCCRRVVYSPNGTEVDNGRCPEPLQQKGALMSYLASGDDCAINELLEGRMDLDVMLPDGRKVRLTVERRTPMMDLLVQAASATKISPAGHTIHVFGDEGGTLPYKPSTPIGSLDANTICIVAKKDTLETASKRNRAPTRPFEPTFRVQVHLPRNQLTVVRVSPRSKVSELRDMVCREKGLDPCKYQLVRPTARGQALDGNMTLSDYGTTEITLLSNSCIESHICNSNSHIISYSKRLEEQKKKTGILRLLAEDANQKALKKIQSPSPSASVHHDPPSTKPPPPRYKPKKRRPAPPPPPPEPAFHSRQSSSDSSGYHEATSSSLLQGGGSCNNEKASSDSSGVSSLDAKVKGAMMMMKKRKAPMPPKEDHMSDKEEIVMSEPDPIPILNSQKMDSSPPVDDPEEASSEVTRVALAALCARLDQDVTQREIACSIQAAFHSLDSRPSLLAIKQRSAEIDTSPESSVDGIDAAPTESILGLAAASTSSLGIPAESTADKVSTSSLAKESIVSEQVTGSAKESIVSEQVTGSAKESLVAKQVTGSATEAVVAKQVTDKALKSSESLVAKHLTDKAPTSAVAKEFIASRQVTDSAKESVVDKKITDKPTKSVVDIQPYVAGRVSHNARNSAESQITHKAATSTASSVLKQLDSDKSVREVNERVSTSVGSCAKQELLKRVTDNLIETECIAPPTSTTQELYTQSRDQKFKKSSIVPSESKTVSKQTVAGATVAAEHPTVRPSSNRPSTKVATEYRNASSIKPPVQNFSSKVLPSAEHPSVHTTGSAKQLSSTSNPPAHPVQTNGRHVVLDSINGCPADEAYSYPLQKSTARLNFDEEEDPLQSFPPPPSQFRSDPPTPPSSTLLRRSSSLLNLSDDLLSSRSTIRKSRSRNLQRSLSDLSDAGGEFEAEQQRLQREYLKLQRQFVLWQQQLLSNHAMLREECIVPQYARTLRQSHSLPEGGEYPEEDDDARTPLVSRSLSYEPSTLPRSAINIPDFGPSSIGSSNTLRSSKTKSYFKPPQVRVSTKNRQRLPPEIKKDMDSYDDSKILSTILPSFDSLKLISEDSDLDIGNLILKPTGKVEKKPSPVESELKKVPSFSNKEIELKKVPSFSNKDIELKKVPSFSNKEIELKKVPSLSNKEIELKKVALKNEARPVLHANNKDAPKKVSNGTENGKKVPPPVPNKTSSLAKVDVMTRVKNDRNRGPENVPANGNVPAPPPMPEKASNGVKKVNGVVRSAEKKVFTPTVDPREQLMQEIRKCGGRTALRKISLDIPS